MTSWDRLRWSLVKSGPEVISRPLRTSPTAGSWAAIMPPKALKPFRAEARFAFCSLVPPSVRMSAVKVANL